MSMRFAFVSPQDHVHFGGSEELWLQAAAKIKERGHFVAVTVPGEPHDFPRFRNLAKWGICIEGRSELPPSLYQRLVTRLGLVKPVRQPQGLGFILESRPDLVVVSQPGYKEGLGWCQALASSKLPYVLICHNVDPGPWPSDDWVDTAAKAYQGAKRVFVVSHRIGELIEDRIGEKLDNLSVVRNPFNVSWTARPPWAESDGGWSLAMVGRLDAAAKAQDIVIRTLSQPKWQNRELDVHIYGDGPQQGILKKLNRRLKARVHFCGRSHDIADIFSRHHGLLQPSHFEGLPMSVVEAMLCQRVIIATKSGGIGEIVTDGVTGFLAEAATVNLVDELLERAWAERMRWKTMGEMAGEEIRKLVPDDPIDVFCRELESIDL
jgi:glycosyltransferase involved in cell wall biosynthesis